MLQRPVALIRAITTGYFAASGTRLLAGRVFADGEPALVAIVSESLAKLLWPGTSADAVVGRRLRQGANASIPLIEVVGVVEDAKAGSHGGALSPL